MATDSERDRSKKNLLYFMKLAYFSSSRCSDPITKAGAVIIRLDRQLVSAGHFDYQGPVEDHRKGFYECHAELNALLNTNDVDVNGCTMYVTNYPCCDCVKLALEAGIAQIIHLKGQEIDENGTIPPVHKATTEMLGRLRRSEFCRSLANASDMEGEIPSATTNIEITDGAGAVTAGWQPLNDEHYFMGMAYLAAERSEDPNTTVGVCIVNLEKRIVGLGYNTFPVGGEDAFSWAGNAENRADPEWISEKYPYVIHAAAMAILKKNTSSLKGCTLYTTHYPDNDCANMIIRSGITEVVYWKNEKKREGKIEVALRMLGDENQRVGSVTVRQFVQRHHVKFQLLGEEVNVFGKQLVTLATTGVQEEIQ